MGVKMSNVRDRRMTVVKPMGRTSNLLGNKDSKLNNSNALNNSGKGNPFGIEMDSINESEEDEGMDLSNLPYKTKNPTAPVSVA
jgi:hypothetical protein